MMTAPLKTYPAGPVTPHGAYHVLNNILPQFSYTSYDETIVFNMMGGLAIADRTLPERVEITDIEGLISPWTSIEQKGATQDGVSYINSLYDPLDVDITVNVRGRDPEHVRQVVSDWVAAWDAKQMGTLAWYTHDQGYWWADVRWAKAATDKLAAMWTLRQPFKWKARAHDGFWRSYDSTALFKLDYAGTTDDFWVTTSGDLGPNWTVAYSGDGGGWMQAGDGAATWVDDPAHPVLTGGRTGTARRNGFTTSGDNQIVSITLGSFSEWSWPDNADIEIWARLNDTGTPGTQGLKLRIATGSVELYGYAGGYPTLLRAWPILIPPLPGETWTLVAGNESDPYLVQVMRNSVTICAMTVSAGYGGVGYRSVGFGMHAGAAVLTQATPPAVRAFTAGDHAAQSSPTSTQTGFVQRVNCGDQPMFDRYTVFGPGTFTFADGPGSTDFVEFGPLLDGQVVQLRTDPRKRGVIDLTSVPVAPGQVASSAVGVLLSDFLSFAAANNTVPLLGAVESLFGITPPQGNLYALLHGRWSDNAAIPPKPAAGPLSTYSVAVGIQNGNANSAILAAGTPLRRWPM